MAGPGIAGRSELFGKRKSGKYSYQKRKLEGEGETTILADAYASSVVDELEFGCEVDLAWLIHPYKTKSKFREEKYIAYQKKLVRNALLTEWLAGITNRHEGERCHRSRRGTKTDTSEPFSTSIKWIPTTFTASDSNSL
jgi:hypothetical protein